MTVEVRRNPGNAPDAEGRREVEWQLSGTDLGAVRKWLNAHRPVAGLTFEPRASRTIHDTYLDTDDGRIRRAGFALRLREDAGRSEATLKDLAPGTDGMRIRREFSEELPSAELDALAGGSGPVSSRVRTVAGPEPLKALFRVRTERECFAALARGGEPAAEIALDDTLVAAPDGDSTSRLIRVEVEALADPPELLASLVGELRSECALEPSTDSKYDVGLKVAGLDLRPPELGSTTVDPAMSVAEVGRANLRRHLASWLAHEPAARLGEDPEQLHQLRVAGRRIETTLRLFEPWLPKALVRQRPGWKAFARALGAVRDLDVQLAGLAGFAAELPLQDAALLDVVRERLSSERRRARTRMLRSLDRPAARRKVERMQRALARARPTRAEASGLAAAVAAPALIRRNFKKMRRAARDLRGDGSAAAHHALRRRAKRLRYTIEAFDGLYGVEAQKLAKAIRRLERTLGSTQDAHIAATRFRALVATRRGHVPSAAAFLVGVLAERHQAATARAGRRLGKRYAKVRGRRWKAMRRVMNELASAYAAPREGTRPHISVLE